MYRCSVQLTTVVLYGFMLCTVPIPTTQCHHIRVLAHEIRHAPQPFLSEIIETTFLFRQATKGDHETTENWKYL